MGGFRFYFLSDIGRIELVQDDAVPLDPVRHIPIGRSVGPVLLQDLQPHAVIGVEDAPVVDEGRLSRGVLC